MTARADADPLFASLRIGAIEAPNRILMAPLTRNRAHGDGTPKAIAETYYAQRASAGLIVTEATQIAPTGKGYLDTPGLHNDEQVAAWRRITDAVHEAGGRIVVQLWHVGRISHVSLLPSGEVPVAPSAVRAAAQTFAPDGFVDVSPPRALAIDELPGLIDTYRHAAERAQQAGFDGVEIHAANGYLLDQFLHANVNQRTDAYGGAPEKRARLVIEVAAAVAQTIGAERTGLRLSPTGSFNDMEPEGEEPTFAALIDALNPLGLAFLHVVEEFPGAQNSAEERALLDRLRDRWQGVYVANGGFDAASARTWIDAGRADAVAFGRPFLANPDLVERYRQGAALNVADQTTFYGGDARGYTDYPFLADAA